MKKTASKNSRKAQVARKLKMLRKAAACAALFAGLLTGLAHGQTTITGNPATGAVNQISAGGVAIEETLSGTLNVAGNTAVPDSSGLIFSAIGYKLTQGLNITNNDATSDNVVTGIRVVSGSSTQTGNKTYEWTGDYNITKSDPGGGQAHATGFEFMHSSTAGQAAIFAGTISGNDMNIRNEQTGVARGLSFHQNNSNGGFDMRGGFNGTIDIESLNVYGEGNTSWGHSTGLFAGNLGTLTADGSAVNIKIDSLDVFSYWGNAAGLDVGNIGNDATLTFGDISINGNLYAVAVSAGNVGTNATIDIDSVDVYSYGNGDGVVLGTIGNDTTLTIGDIDVSAYDDGIGLSAGNVGTNVAIDIDSVNVYSMDGYAGGMTLGDIGNGTEITIGSIDVDGEYDGLGMSVGDIGNNVTINIENITVEGDYGDAMGFTAGDIGAAEITIESINIQGGDNATGISVGDIGNNAVIDVTTIDVESYYEDGMGFFAGTIGNGATLTFGDIAARVESYGGYSYGDATALMAGNVGSNVTIEIDTVFASSDGDDAEGVILGDIGNGTKITVGSIEVDGEYDGLGMSVGDIGNNVEIDITTIDVTGNYGYGTGFIARDIGASAITIESIDVYSDDDAMGMLVRDITGAATVDVTTINVETHYGDGTGFLAGDIQNGATLTFETIDVSAGDDAEGFVAARVGAAKITIENVVSNGQDDATGVRIHEIGDGTRIKIDDIQAWGGYGDGVGFQADIVNQSTLTFGDFDAKADVNATGLHFGSLNSGATVNITGDGNATTYSYYGDGTAAGIQAGSITGATINAADSTISAHVTSADWGTGNGNAFGVSVGGNVTDSTLTFKALDATVDNIGTAVGFSALDVDASNITIDSISAKTLDGTGMFAGADKATGVKLLNVVNGSELKIGTISAEAVLYGDAIGFEAAQLDNSHVTLDNVTAATDIGNATGVLVSGNIQNKAVLTINESILAKTTTKGNTAGLTAQDVDGAQILAHNATIVAMNNANGADNATGSAKGVALRDVLGGSNIDLNIVGASVVDDPENPTSGKGDAVGFEARDVVSGNVTIAHAGAMSLNGNATGVNLRDVGPGANLTLTHIGSTVAEYGNGEAIGLNARNVDSGATFSLGQIDVTNPGDGNATGIKLSSIFGSGDQASSLSLKNAQISVKASGLRNTATGLHVLNNIDKTNLTLGAIDAYSGQGDAYGVRIDGYVNNDSSLATGGDITATTRHPNGGGTAYGIYAKSFGSNGLTINNTVTAIGDADAGNDAIAVYASEGNNKITLEKDAVLDAHNAVSGEQYSAIDLGDNTKPNTRNLVVFDTKGEWNNGGKTFDTSGVSDFVFEEGTEATITGYQTMTTSKDGGVNVASTATVKSGASVILDGSVTDTKFDMESANGKSGTFLVEEGASIDALSKSDSNSAAIDGNLALDGQMTLRFKGNNNVGLYVGDNGGDKGGVITVGDAAKIDVVLDGSFEGTLEVAETAWEDNLGNRDQTALDYISDKITTNTFYNLEAINADGGYLGYRGRDYVLMPEMFVLASQFHNYRSISDATADRFALARTQYAGISPCDQSCLTDCDLPNVKKSNFGRNAWVNWVGRGNDQLRSRVTGGDMDFSSNGIQVGLDIYKTNRFLVGIMYGYEDGKLNAKDGYGSHMKGQDNYFGLYGQYILRSGFDLSGTLGYGSQDFDLVRSNRYGTHKASFDADSLEATLELGYMFKLRKNLTLRPVLALDIYNSDVDGATEVGDWDRSRYNDYSLTQTFLRFGADARLTRKWFSVDAGVYYSYQMNSDAKTVSAGVTSVNQLITRPMEYKLGDSVLTVNVGGNVFLNKARTLSMFGGYNVDFYTDRINDQALHNGRVGVSYRF